MSRDRKINPFEAKAIARRKYAERQMTSGSNGAGMLEVKYHIVK